MSIELTRIKEGKALEVAVSGKLRNEDYQRFIPEFEQLLKAHGKISVLFEMSQFHGWEVKAAWADLKFDLKHYHDIERVAVVGEKKWHQWMTTFFKPFTAAELRYFDHAEAGKARAWIVENEGKTKVPEVTPA